jgi:7-cyano-7-deazaguanine reductase
MKTKFLGKVNNKSKKTGKSLLDNIPRIKEGIKFGFDIWNVYDFMYLDKNKIPHLSVIEITIPSNSDFIIESKSMKLYLNHFYNKSFKTNSEISKIIKKDIEYKIKSKIKVRFIKSFYKEPDFININNLKLKTSPNKKVLKFNGFRSICPVTSQPDFASIYIYSDKSIDTKWIKNYLISFSDHGGFHEQCIELIFIELKNKFQINHLEVCGRFQRRGGIDINPVRGTHCKKLFNNFREFNQ